jgi:ribonuclease P protein component
VSQPGGRARTFPRAQRVRRQAEFRDVYAKGRRIGNEMFAANVLANGTDSARLGLSIAVRSAGNAVRRNRMRRLIRESFRLHRSALPALDIVVSGAPGPRGQPGDIARSARATVAEDRGLMSTLIRALLRAYQLTLSPLLGPRAVSTPPARTTCRRPWPCMAHCAACGWGCGGSHAATR